MVVDICCGWCLCGIELDVLEVDMGLEVELDVMLFYL